MGTIAQKLAAVASSKAAIGTAIEGRGGTVPTKLSDYGTAVAALPNAYAAGDEGKVVSSGALVAQTSRNIDQNGTYNTTTNNSITVSVSGGGSGPFAAVVSRKSFPTYTVSASDLAGATTIGDSAFFACSGLTSITIPDSVTSIAADAFSGCSGLTSITIPDSVTSFAARAFSGCRGLTSITIPDSVTSIAVQTFSNCSSLATIDFGTTRSTIPTLAGINAFINLPENYQILVPSALLTDWQAASVWSNIASHIVAHP